MEPLEPPDRRLWGGARLRGTVELPRLASRLLAGNRLGDPAEREVLVYRPPGASSSEAYPLVLVLPAYAAGHRSLLGYRLWDVNLFERYERLLEAGTVPAAILVAPDCMTRWGGSQFVDSPGTGPYQRYLVEEVLPFVEARYPVRRDPAGRVVLGRSSGGFGALRLGLDRPGLFGGVGSHAGDALFEVSMRPMFTKAAIAFDRAGGVAPFVARIEEEGPKGGADFDGIITLAEAAAYSPADASPWPELPFDPATGELREEVWARWLTHDPVARIAAAPAPFEGVRVFLDAGDRDEHGLHFAARKMARQLRERGVEVHHEEFPGGHRGTAHRYDRSLEVLLGGR
jgi:enterochelin esterase-like enzyme